MTAANPKQRAKGVFNIPENKLALYNKISRECVFLLEKYRDFHD